MSTRQSPFERLLGAEFERLPAPVRRLHALRQPLRTTGRADATVASGVFARLICRLMGLPHAGRDMMVSVVFTPDGNGGERWERQFGDRRYASRIAAGDGRDAGFLVERFGWFDLKFRLAPRSDGLQWSLAGWRLLGVPLPYWSVPKAGSLESADGERFTFDIEAAFPLLGRLIRYRGWLMPVDDGSSQTPA